MKTSSDRIVVKTVKRTASIDRYYLKTASHKDESTSLSISEIVSEGHGRKKKRGREREREVSRDGGRSVGR